MNIYRYSILLITAFVACACIEETKLDVVNPQAGVDVQFGLTLGKIADTRTVYGEENADKTAFPIYWVNGDKVLIASPQCVEGRNSAEYRVSCSTSTQNYADELVKTGDTGIQWSSASTADFYSIYPSTGSSLKVVEDGVQARLKVASTQYAKTTASADGSVLYAQPEDMGNVIMYAYSPNVANDGNPVQLKYKPFSTVIEFEIHAPNVQASGEQVGNIVVQSITLSTPEGNQKNIAGNFTFNFPQSSSGVPTITPESTTVSKENTAITVHFLEGSEYKTNLTYGKKLKAKMCLMPIGNVSNMTGWVVTVSTSAGTFTKTITEGSNINTSLEPGMVHKIVLPRLSYAEREWEYENTDWITSIPDYKNVYLTELSLPGAWYAGTPTSQNYQATANIQTLWNNGVRAFAVETKTMSGNRSSQVNPNGVVVSGLGSDGSSHAGGKNSLNVDAQGNQVEGPSGKAYRKYRGLQDGEGTQISKIISDVASAVTEDEFGVLILSYADGGDGGRRYVDYGAWLAMLYSEFNSITNTDIKNKIYGVKANEEITENTTIGDVLGKLIIKVNVDANIAQSGSVVYDTDRVWVEGDGWFGGHYEEVDLIQTYVYENNLPAVFSYDPFIQQIENPDFTKPYYSTIYWKDWSDDNRSYTSVLSNNAGFTWCFSSANRTSTDNSSDTTIPEYKDRIAALGAMMAKSKEIYESSTHNVWFYFNCGGTQASSMSSSNPSPTNFATVMNSWLLNTINAKLNTTDASPLGIVMFNQCTNSTYNGPAIIEAIVKMNSKFYLKHAGDDTSSPGAGPIGTPLVGIGDWENEIL